MAANLSNLLSKLSASQLATITFESGVDSSGQISSASFEGYIAATTTAANPGKPASTIQLSTWQTHLGTGATVSYSFLSGGAAYAFTGLEQDYATQALQLWSGVANINFAYRLPAQGAQVVFLHSFDKLSAQPNPVPAGTAWSPGAAIDTQTTGLVQQQTGSINVDNTSTQGGALSYGSISSYTSVEGFGIDSLIHEAGHLLGLGHSGPYNSTGPSDKTDFATLQNNNTDVLQWSVMSYISPNSKTAPNYGKYNPLPSDTTEAAWGNQRAPFSPMGMDIFAAQRLYGAPTSTMFSGGKTFGFNSTVMYRKIDGTQGKLSMFDFDQTYDANGNATHLNDETPVLTLFDTGANNTFDVSGFTTASNIDLRDGEFSSVASLHDNIFIEYGTQIDHVIGGAGDDTFTVNDRSDVIDGGGGINTVKFVSPRSAYVLSYSGASTILTNSSSGAAYRLTNIQQFQFGAAPAIALSDLPRVQWKGPSGGHFGIAANWSNKQVPNSTSQVEIFSGANILVTQQEANEVDSLVLASGATIDIASGRFVIDNVAAGSTNAGTIQVESGSTLFLAGGLTNTGSVTLYGGILQTYSQTVSLSGGGTVTLQDGHIGGRDASGSPLAYDTFTNVDNLITGSGSIGRSGFLYPLQFHNAENANVVAASGTLLVAASITNDGIMGASNDGLLDLSGSIDQTSGGRIVSLGTNAHVVLDGGTITGGSITAVTGTVEVATNETLAGVTLSGAFKVDAGTKLTLVGNIDATGAVIDASAGQIDLTQAHLTGGSIKFSPNQPLNGLVVNGADLSGYVINHNETVTVIGATTNSTTLNVTGFSGYGPATLAISGTTTLSGGGAVILSDGYGANSDLAYITGFGPSDILENVNNTIRGNGELGQGKLVFNNDANGTVNATAATLRLWAVSASNSGLLESTGGLLLIEAAVDAGGGTILAADKGTVQLGGDGRATTITAGTLRSVGSGIINVDTSGATFDGSNYAVNQQATLNVVHQATLTVKGLIANTGVININGQSGYGQTTLAISGPVSLQGGGRVTLNDTYGAQGIVSAIAGSSVADVLTNADNRIDGFGSIGQGVLTVVNKGQITASGGTLTIDTGAATITNNGTLEGYGGTLVIKSALTNTGSVIGTTGGTIVVRNSVVNTGSLDFEVDSRVVLDHGVLGGTGTLTVSANATAEIQGGSAGTIDGTTQVVALAGTALVDHAATLTLKGTIANTGTIAINGQSGYGQSTVVISGQVILNGKGTVTLNDTYGAFGTVSAIAGASVADVLTNIDNTISGYGSIGQGTMTLDNRGTIDASVATLTLDTGAAVIVNSGLLEGVGGTLVVASAVADAGRIVAGVSGSVVLRKAVTGAGSVQAAAGGKVALDGGALSNTGGVASVATGVVEVISTGTIDGTAQTVALAGTTVVDRAAILTLKGTIGNTGAIAINGQSGYGQSGILVSGPVTLSGGGTFTLNDVYGAFGNVSAIAGTSTADVLTNIDNTISGYGELGQGTLAFVNKAAGVVNATAGTLRLDAAVTNTGLLEATGGTLRIEAAVANAGGIILAAAGSVKLGGDGLAATVRGGTLRSIGTGTFSIDQLGATLDGTAAAIALQGSLAVNAALAVSVKGSLVNSGSVALNGSSGYGPTTFAVLGPVVLSGGGAITMSDNYGAFGDVAAIAGASAADTLDNVDNTISGYGHIKALTLTNETGGVIDATAGTLTIDTAAVGAVLTNKGLLEALGGTLTIGSNTVNTGTILAGTNSTVRLQRVTSNAGAVRVDTGGKLVLDGGAVAGTGTLSSVAGSTIEVTSGGVISGVGQSVTLAGTTIVDQTGLLVLVGAIRNTGGIAINGRSGYGATTVQVSGPTTLSGGGTVTLSDTYGAQGDVATLSGASVSDALDNVDNVISGYGELGAGTMSFTNEAAGVVNASAATLTLNFGTTTAVNRGLLEATSGTLAVVSKIASTGSVLAAGGTVNFAAGNATNLASGTLTGGTWTARGGTIALANALTTDAATIVLDGTGSTIMANGASIENSLASITAAGSLQVLGGKAWAGTTALTNAGEIRLGGGSFAATSISNTGKIDGTGTITAGITGAGIIEAAGGTLTLTKQVSGALLMDAGSTLVVKGGAASGATLHFAGPGGIVQIVPGAGAQPFNGRVIGSTVGDTIDLVGIAATGTNAGSTTTLSYGGVTIGTVTFDLGFVGSLASDGHGGTLITAASPDPLFDPTYYLVQNLDVAAAGIDPYQHYMTNGWREGRNPSALFNTTYYLNQNGDVKAAGIDPLAHFESSGWREGRDPSAAFSLSGYLTANPDVRAAGLDPLLHYVTNGKAEGRMAVPATPHATGLVDPLVDAAFVYAHNPAVAAAGLGAAAWYHSVGWTQGANPDAFFDTSYYLSHNPDVAAAHIDPLAHFENNGWKEGREPSLVFNDARYLSSYPDVKAAGLDPLQHYMANGQAEGRMAFLAGGTAPVDPLVDAGYYDKQLGATIVPPGLAGAQQAAYAYDNGGWQKGLNPDAFFDTSYYLSHNPDVAAAHIDPLAHFENNGWKEGRDPSAAFSTNKYLAAYGDVKAAGLDPLVHYIQSGQAEGRSAFSV